MTKYEIELAHSAMVKKLAKPGEEIKRSLTAEQCNLLHAILGLVTEVGELADTVKKHVIYNQCLDITNMEEECGDVEFYFEQLRQELKLTREQILQHNLNKLALRYPNFEYTDKRAKERADKSKS